MLPLSSGFTPFKRLQNLRYALTSSTQTPPPAATHLHDELNGAASPQLSPRPSSEVNNLAHVIICARRSLILDLFMNT